VSLQNHHRRPHAQKPPILARAGAARGSRLSDGLLDASERQGTRLMRINGHLARSSDDTETTLRPGRAEFRSESDDVILTFWRSSSRRSLDSPDLFRQTILHRPICMKTTEFATNARFSVAGVSGLGSQGGTGVRTSSTCQLVSEISAALQIAT
jgi:hypothetical protein